MDQLTEKQYRDLKREVEEAKAASERARGALDQIMLQLKEDFDCDDVKEAKAKLEELQKENEKAEKLFLKALKDYEDKWKEKE